MEKSQILNATETFLKTQPEKCFEFSKGTIVNVELCGTKTLTNIFKIYITDYPRRAEDNIILVSRPIWDIEDVNDVDCFSHFSIDECSDILRCVFRQSIERGHTEITDIFKENGLTI